MKYVTACLSWPKESLRAIGLIECMQIVNSKKIPVFYHFSVISYWVTVCMAILRRS